MSPTDNEAIRNENAGMRRLVSAVQELSLARSLDAVMAIVRAAARELTGADGATFVLRDRDQCYYADEDAIAPLWKGQRFPMTACISGWTMLHAEPALIEDIYADPRIPADAYRPTFVKSLAMVPIRKESPIGAIGNYWAARHKTTVAELELLQALANTTSVAIENIQLYDQLEQRVRDRTEELQLANAELEAFAAGLAHDLQAPTRHIAGFADILLRSCAEKFNEDEKRHFARIIGASERMQQLITDLLGFARLGKTGMARETVELDSLLSVVLEELRPETNGRAIEWKIAKLPRVRGDYSMLRQVFCNLLSNALKFSRQRNPAAIEIGTAEGGTGEVVLFVRDNGAGFSMEYAAKLFGVFQRLHSHTEFEGTGIGLANVRRIVKRHGGRVWAEGNPGQGASFYLSLPS